MSEPTQERMKCPKCGSSHYYYEGTYIACHGCEYTEKLFVDGEIIAPIKWGYKEIFKEEK